MNTDKLRIVPLGGLEDVTKNMYVYEYWKNGVIADIVIIDCGVGFLSHLESLGVDSAIPDVSYLLDKKHLIRALLITHGHEDHIGAIPYVIEKLGFPPIFAPKLAGLLIKEKLEQENITSAKIVFIKHRYDYIFGSIKARYIHMTHSIPDTTHIVIDTPSARVYHGSDFKMDLTPVNADPPDFAEIVRAGGQGIDLLLSDGLGSEREGYTLSEQIVGTTFRREMLETKGRFFMTTFASNISRIRQCVTSALEFNRKICFVGSSMKRNTAIAIEEGYLPLKKDHLIPEQDLKKMRPNAVCVILTGSQGEFGSALDKVSTGRNRFIKVQKGDRIFFSSDPIPGNEMHIQDVIENLIEQGADVIYTAIRDALHTSGHGSQGDLKLLARLVGAKNLMPIGTTIKHSKAYMNLMKKLGYQDSQLHMLHSGQPIAVTHAGISMEEKIILKEILVDGSSVGDVGDRILEERESLGKEGILVVLVSNGKVSLDSKGFMFNDRKLFGDIIPKVESMLKQTTDKQKLENRIVQEIGGFISAQHARSPLIIPVIV
ncbi:MAG: ribonuclease J [Candidatus Roizmanbacteria bacterium]|nr:ribonuclease J [Candidatus Roizmanbacteria bacterium]